MRTTLEPASGATDEPRGERSAHRQSSWGFLTEPKWVAGHVLVVVTTVGFLLLGFWQLDRNDEKHAEDRAARAAFAAPAPVLGPAGSEPAVGERVEASGTYDPDGEVLLRNRVRDGEGGYELLTPLLLDDGTAVVVNRGWVSRNVVDRGDDVLVPPAGTVTVRGPVGASRPLTADDTVDERAGRVTLPRVDLERIGEEVPYDIRAVSLTAQWQELPGATNAGTPALPTPPPSDDVNHMQYAIQWFAFALIPLVGWPVVLSRVAKRPPSA